MNAPTSFYWSLIVYPLFPIAMPKGVPADFEAFQQRTISGYRRKLGTVQKRASGNSVGERHSSVEHSLVKNERSADTAPYARTTRKTAPPGTHPAWQLP